LAEDHDEIRGGGPWAPARAAEHRGSDLSSERFEDYTRVKHVMSFIG